MSPPNSPAFVGEQCQIAGAATIPAPTAGQPAIREQIRLTWARCAANAPRALREESKRNLRLACHVARFYRELADIGLQLQCLNELEQLHVQALLNLWRRKRKALSTIRSEWSVLRAWAIALDKPDLIGPLTAYWDENPRQRERCVQKGSSPRHRDIALIKMLESTDDATHYWIERVCAALQVSVVQALTMDFQPVLRYLEGRRGDVLAPRLTAAVAARPHEVRAVTLAVQAFLRSVGRVELLWPSLQVAQAAKRHANHLAYRRRQLKTKKV